MRALPKDFADAEIVMIDNLSSQRFVTLFDLPTGARYRFVEADVTRTALVPYFEGAYAVVHLAAMTDAAGSFDRAAELELNNYQATQQVAMACQDTGARLIHLSSTSVYGPRTGWFEDCPASN